MNAGGNIGLGYSVSSTTIYPSIRYCGQTAAANGVANNTLDFPETSIFEGANSQTGANRWGDYSKISLDPLDDGTYWFTTEYIGAGGSRKSKIASFNIGPVPPITSFTTSTTTPCLGSTVTFTDQSNGAPSAWKWSFTPSTCQFVDGTDSTSQNPHVKFLAYGNYSATLTATNVAGPTTLTKPAYIAVNLVNNNFAANSTSVVFGNSVIFADLSSCNISSWHWDFGDGASPATSNTPGNQVVTYNTTGLKTVSLTLNDTIVNTKTDYINVVDSVFNMGNTSLSVCSGHFYDSGGPGANYGNNLDYTMVFNPGTPGNNIQVTFATFLLEVQMFCANDYLKIYDGNSTSSPLIGVYCGNHSPGTVTANNATGSLTFVFHSNATGGFPGWDASVACIQGVANPFSLSASAVSSEQIDLSWAQNPSNNPVMLTWSADGVFGVPVTGATYAAADTIAGGGTVLYMGSNSAFSHTLLSPETMYYYKAFSLDVSGKWSSGIMANAATLALPSINITPMAQQVGEPAGSTSFTVASNAAWTTSSNAGWCTSTPSGFGNGIITASFSENTGPVIRTANIAVNVTGLPVQTLQVIQLPSFVSVPESPADAIQLFPNPNSGLFTISGASGSVLNMNVTILDMSGKTVLSRLCSGASQYSFDLTASPKGSYYVKLETGLKTLRWKLMIN